MPTKAKETKTAAAKGTRNKRATRRFLPFSKARAFARTTGIKTENEWVNWCSAGNRPSNVPAAPYSTYREQWRGWPNFLRGERPRARKAGGA